MTFYTGKRAVTLLLVLMLSLGVIPFGVSAQEEPPISLQATDVILDQTEFLYTGSEIRPNVTVRVEEKLLTLDQDYTLEFRNNVEPGEAQVLVTGIPEAGYEGTVEHPFFILPAQEEKTEITSSDVTLDTISLPYTGQPVEPKVTVSVEGKVLAEGTDYTVAYENNIQPGTAQVIVTGTGDYTGLVSVDFTIEEPVKPEPPAATELKAENVTLEGSRFAGTGKPIQPKLTVRVEDKVLAEGTDYTVAYENNIQPGTAQVIVTGKGAYTGQVKVDFTIFAAPKVTEGSGALWRQKSSKDLSFRTNQQSPVTAVSVDGKALSSGDYSVSAQGDRVTLKAPFLRKLAVGQHSVSISYADGQATASFQVLPAASGDNPPTGDSIHLWTGVLFVTMTAGIGLAYAWKKRLI